MQWSWKPSMRSSGQFERNRARATARTEVLTASSQANWESFMQSPAVEGKEWKQSGAKKKQATPYTCHNGRRCCWSG